MYHLYRQKRVLVKMKKLCVNHTNYNMTVFFFRKLVLYFFSLTHGVLKEMTLGK